MIIKFNLWMNSYCFIILAFLSFNYFIWCYQLKSKCFHPTECPEQSCFGLPTAPVPSPVPLPGISIPRAACQTPQPPEIPLNFPTWLGTPGKNVSIKNAFTLVYNAKVIVSAIKREKIIFTLNTKWTSIITFLQLKPV